MNIIDFSASNNFKSFNNTPIGSVKKLITFLANDNNRKKRIYIEFNIKAPTYRMFCFHIVGYSYSSNKSFNVVISGYINNNKIQRSNSTDNNFIVFLNKNNRLVVKIKLKPYYTFFNISAIIGDNNSKNIDVKRIVVEKPGVYGA